MKKFLLPALAVLALASACKKNDDTTPAIMQVSGTMTGAKEVPANSSTATGSVTGTYDPSSKVFNYTITFSGLSATSTGAHFHYGSTKRATGPVFLSLTSVTPKETSGTITGTATLTQMQVDSLLAGRIYANVHSGATAEYKSEGEIRSNLTVK